MLIIDKFWHDLECLQDYAFPNLPNMTQIINDSEYDKLGLTTERSVLRFYQMRIAQPINLYY